jgi:hypothetical protein
MGTDTFVLCALWTNERHDKKIDPFFLQGMLTLELTPVREDTTGYTYFILSPTSH